jgi:hypothetical protein
MLYLILMMIAAWCCSGGQIGVARVNLMSAGLAC